MKLLDRRCKKLCRPISLRELADLLEIEWGDGSRKRLTRQLRRREAATGCKVLFRDYGSHTWYTTRAALLAACPEFFLRRDPLERKALEELDSQKRIIMSIAARLDGLREILASHVNDGGIHTVIHSHPRMAATA